MQSERVKMMTGKSLEEWYEDLDKMGGRELEHKQIADHLHEELDVAYWWAQEITVEYERYIGRRIKGQMADGTFQLGIRRTMPVGMEELWTRIYENMELWANGAGEIGKITTLREGSHFRMKWKEESWPTHSILQIRVMESTGADRAVCAVHQEKIPGPGERERLLEHWENVQGRLLSMLAEG